MNGPEALGLTYILGAVLALAWFVSFPDRRPEGPLGLGLAVLAWPVGVPLALWWPRRL